MTLVEKVFTQNFSIPIHVPEMFKTNFMLQIQSPTWALLNQLVTKKSLKTLKQLQNDVIIQDFAKPVLMLIEKAFLPQKNEFDPILTNWNSAAIKKRSKDKIARLNALSSRAGLSVHTKMVRLDDEIEEILTRAINTSWFKVARATFEDGPHIVCYPKMVEMALLNKEKVDPTPFDESNLDVNSDDYFHIDNHHSQSLFANRQEDEDMEPIEIVAVSSTENDS